MLEDGGPADAQPLLVLGPPPPDGVALPPFWCVFLSPMELAGAYPSTRELAVHDTMPGAGTGRPNSSSSA